MGNTERKSSILTLKLPRELERELERAAQRRGVSKSALAREALVRFVAEPKPRQYRPSALDLAGNLVGGTRSGPRDLSTNPKYLDDLGLD